MTIDNIAKQGPKANEGILQVFYIDATNYDPTAKNFEDSGVSVTIIGHLPESQVDEFVKKDFLDNYVVEPSAGTALDEAVDSSEEDSEYMSPKEFIEETLKKCFEVEANDQLQEDLREFLEESLFDVIVEDNRVHLLEALDLVGLDEYYPRLAAELYITFGRFVDEVVGKDLARFQDQYQDYIEELQDALELKKLYDADISDDEDDEIAYEEEMSRPVMAAQLVRHKDFFANAIVQFEEGAFEDTAKVLESYLAMPQHLFRHSSPTAIAERVFQTWALAGEGFGVNGVEAVVTKNEFEEVSYPGDECEGCESCHHYCAG